MDLKTLAVVSLALLLRSERTHLPRKCWAVGFSPPPAYLLPSQSIHEETKRCEEAKAESELEYDALRHGIYSSFLSFLTVKSR